MHLTPLDTHAGLLIRTWTRYSEPGPPHPHVDPLFRTWATPPTCGTAGLHAEQGVYVRNRGSTCGTGGTAVHQTRYITREPAIPSLGLLIRTWTRYSEPGQHRPHAEQRVNMRNRGFTCGTATGGPAWGRPSCMPARRSRALWALCVSDAGRQRSLRGSCPWRGRRGLPRVPRRRYPRASRPKR